MTSKIDEALSAYKAAFPELSEGNTSAMSLVPTGEEMSRAVDLASKLPTEAVGRDLGSVCGQHLAMLLERAGFRPADYAYVKPFSQAFIKHLLEELGKPGSATRVAFLEQLNDDLSLRG